MKTDKIKALIDKYFEGETSLEEEEILKAYFSAPEVSEELQSYTQHFQFFNKWKNKKPSGILDNETLFAGMEDVQENKNAPVIPILKGAPSPPWLRYAAGLALLILGFIGGLMVDKGKESTPEVVSNTTLDDGKSQVILTGLNNESSASERILAINESLEMKDINQEIALALIRTMNYDDNINVRLAAVEALSHYTGRNDVRKSMIQSLEIQDHPIIQIALIDLLVNIDEKNAINEIKRIMIDENTQEVVKRRAEVGVSLLM